MKTLIAFIIGLAFAVSVHAQDTKARLISLAEGVNDAKAFSLAVYPGFAPDIKVNGVKSQWGAGMAVLYPTTSLVPYSFAGARLDYLGDQFWQPSVTLGFKADVLILGKYNVSPFTLGGAIFPLSGSSQDGQVGAIVGGGFTSCLWKSDDGKRAFNVFYAVEKWTLFDGVIHRPGVAFSMKF
jgi:hypothetical protein